MSNRRASSSSQVSGFTQDELKDLILKLQTLLAYHNNSTCCHTRGATASNVLKETCRYIKKLQKEVDDLSERLSKLVASGDITAIDEDIIILERLLQK